MRKPINALVTSSRDNTLGQVLAFLELACVIGFCMYVLQYSQRPSDPQETPRPDCTKVCEVQGKEVDKEVEIDGVTHCVCKDLVCY